MPLNPLVRVGVLSKRAPDRPEPIPPTPEHYAGSNNPYRGIEDHGVAADNRPNPPGMDADNREGYHYLPPEREIEPIPVEIVNQFGREFRRHRVHKMTVNNSLGIQFVGRNDARTSILVQNRDAVNSIYLYHAPIDPAGGPIVGFEIAAKEELTLTSQAAIYVVGSNVAYSTIQAIEYYSVEE